MGFPRRAELRREPPVRAESNESCRLFPLLSAHDLLHRRGEVVVSQPLKDPAEPSKSQLVSFQESLLRGIRKSAVEGRSTRHAAQGKHL